MKVNLKSITPNKETKKILKKELPIITSALKWQ